MRRDSTALNDRLRPGWQQREIMRGLTAGKVWHWRMSVFSNVDESMLPLYLRHQQAEHQGE